MRILALPALLLCGFQQSTPTPRTGEKKPSEPAPAVAPVQDGIDRIVLLDRSEVRGEIIGYEAAGRIRLKDKESGRVLEVPIEDVARLQFGAEDKASRAAEPAEQVRLAYGGMVSGKLVAFDGAIAVVDTPAGSFRLRRPDIKSFLLGPLTSTLPDLKDEGRDIVIREIEKKEEGRDKPVKQAVADYGRLVSIDKFVVFRVALPLKEGEKPESRKEEVREYDRSSVKHLYLHREGGAADLPPGWFTKVTLKNGDRLVGVLQSFTREKVRFFSHLFGSAEIEKQRIRSIAFVQNARMTIGNILVCDQGGVKELDRAGNELWTYAQNTQYAWIARKLENGNVLIANTNANQVLEVKPSGRSGGEVVWRIDNTNYPYDVVRLDNGNTLVAEYYANKVVEYDAKTKNVVWQVAVTYPMSVQRLDNGNTLISTNVQVIEVNREGRNVWGPALRDVRPWRAQRLENGNTLITDFQRGHVVEIDVLGNEVWRRQGLSHPVQAIRLEDGNTLILEQGNNRLIEVDPSHPAGIVNEIRRGISYPQGMSTY